MTKAKTLAKALNAAQSQDHKAIANKLADEMNIGLYWLGTGSNYNGRPLANVWQIKGGRWVRQLGVVALGYDGVWRG